MALKKILGLDIGTTSVGWAVTKELKNGNWTIDDFGVRIFNEPVDPKKGSSYAAERRTFRSKRRLTRRRARRIRDLKYYLQKYGSITVEKINDHFKKLNDKNQNKNYKYSDNLNPYFIRKIAIEKEDSIDWLQFAIALINIAKKRGYDDSFITKSINSEENKNGDSYYDRIQLGQKLIKDHKYPITALEHLKIFVNRNEKNISLNNGFKYVKNTEPNKKFLDKQNNKSHDFFYFSRLDYLNEVKEIIRKQKKGLNLSKELIQRLIGGNENEDKKISAIFRQRPFEDGPGDSKNEKRKYKGFSQDNVGNDIFLNEKRMWSSLIINDLFILLSEISKTNILCEIKEQDLIKFNQNMILKYFDCIFKDDKAFKKEFLSCALDFNISKENIEINISENFNFRSLFLNKLSQFINDDFLKNGLKEIKEFVFTKNKNFDAIETNKFALDKFGNLIAENITPWLLLEKLKESNFYNEFDQNKINSYFDDKTKKNKIHFKDLDQKIIYIVNLFSTSPSKVSYRYAFMALDNFIFKGKWYGDFQAEFNKNNDNENCKTIVKTAFGPICDPDVAHNPMVMRALSQARKVVKELYKEYKWFDSIVVESARELTSSLKDRKKIKDKQAQNYIENLEISNILEQYKISNNAVNKRKIKLYKSQNEVSIYSGKPIDISRLDDYEIDHIIPQSKINNDSFDNIVLVTKEENQIKRNRTPLEAASDLINDTSAYESRCLKLKKDGHISKRKYILLMAKSVNDEAVKNIVNDFASRELNDTRYISKYFTSYLKESIDIYCEENNYKHKKSDFRVFNPTGTLTSRYRKAWLYNSGWGLEFKTRNISHFHHAVDAIILSNMASESRIKFYTDCSRIWNLVKNKSNKNLSEKQIECKTKELDYTFNEIIYSWQNQKNPYGLWFPDYKKRFEAIKNMDFSNKEFASFAKISPPIVGLEELQNHIKERIPVKLSIEKIEENIKDSDNNEKVIIHDQPKLEKIIWEEEYNQEEIKCLKKLFPDSNIRYPFISYKQNNKIRGSFAGSENYISEKKFNDPKTDKSSYRKTKNGIISLRNYYGVLIVKNSDKKFDFIRIRQLDIIEKKNAEIKKHKKIDLQKIFKEFLNNKTKEIEGKIVGILRPGTIFKGLRDSTWKICVYKGVKTLNQITSPYIFIPDYRYKENNKEISSHRQNTGWKPNPLNSYFSDIKILKIDILGRRIN